MLIAHSYPFQPPFEVHAYMYVTALLFHLFRGSKTHTDNPILTTLNMHSMPKSGCHWVKKCTRQLSSCSECALRPPVTIWSVRASTCKSPRANHTFSTQIPSPHFPQIFWAIQQNGSSLAQRYPGHHKEPVGMAAAAPWWVLYVPSCTHTTTSTSAPKQTHKSLLWADSSTASTSQLRKGTAWALCHDGEPCRAFWPIWFTPWTTSFPTQSFKNTNSPVVKHLKHPLRAFLRSRSFAYDPAVSQRPRAPP